MRKNTRVTTAVSGTGSGYALGQAYLNFRLSTILITDARAGEERSNLSLAAFTFPGALIRVSFRGESCRNAFEYNGFPRLFKPDTLGNRQRFETHRRANELRCFANVCNQLVRAVGREPGSIGVYAARPFLWWEN